MVLRARVDTRNLTKRLPSAHHRRRSWRFTCWSFLVRTWEWLTAMPLLARLPVSSQTRDMDDLPIGNNWPSGLDVNLAKGPPGLWGEAGMAGGSRWRGTHGGPAAQARPRWSS